MSNYLRLGPNLYDPVSGKQVGYVDIFGNEQPVAGSTATPKAGVAEPLLNQPLLAQPLYCYSNSYEASDTVNTVGTRAIVRLASFNGMPLTNKAANGTTMQDFAVNMIGTANTYPVALKGAVFIGNPLNDACRNTPNPTTAVTQQGFLNALVASIFRGMTSTVVSESNAAFAYSGTWTTGTQAAYSTGTLKQSSVVGSAVTITTPVCTDCVLISYGVNAVTSGDLTYSLDGAQRGVLSNPPSGVSPSSGITTSPVALVFTGMASAAHTIVATKTDATTNLVFVDDLFVLNPTPPLVIVNKAGYITSAGYTTEGSFGSDATIDTYNALVDTAVATVRAAYPAARIVVNDPNAAGWDKTTMIGSDGLHPNDRGESFLFNLQNGNINTYFAANPWPKGISL